MIKEGHVMRHRLFNKIFFIKNGKSPCRSRVEDEDGATRKVKNRDPDSSEGMRFEPA